MTVFVRVSKTAVIQPASRASVYTHLQNARKWHVPFPRFACWGVSAPSSKTHPENRMAAHLRCLYAGRLSLVLLRSLRSWRSLLRGKIRPQIFPVREQFPRLFPRVAVRRVSLFFLRKQLTVFHFLDGSFCSPSSLNARFAARCLSISC